MRIRLGITALSASLALGVALLVLPAFGAQGHAAAAAGGKATKPFKGKMSYTETNSGHSHGGAVTGIEGHGTFSATLSGRAALEVAVIALATGVPVTKIAQGGSYAVQRNIDAKGRITGTLVASFRARGLGRACGTYTVKPGKFVPGSSFVPMSGTFSTAGGTGAAAHWRISAKFSETSVSGMSVEQLGGSGSESAFTGKAKPMSAACKRVAKISTR